MGRYLLGGKEAKLPYEVEELDLRLYTAEELCYYIYNNLALIDDDFIDERLLRFLSDELGMPEETEKISRFYKSPSDQDTTLLMLLTDIGYYQDAELSEFKTRLSIRHRKSGPDRVLMKADALFENKRYLKAIQYYRVLANERKDNRITGEIRTRIFESIANAYGMLYDYEDAMFYLGKAFEETKKERLLEKLYFTCLVSGSELPDKYFKDFPETKLKDWHENYWLRESEMKNFLQEEPLMKAFFKDKKEMEEQLTRYVEGEKALYRAMLE